MAHSISDLYKTLVQSNLSMFLDGEMLTYLLELYRMLMVSTILVERMELSASGKQKIIYK